MFEIKFDQSDIARLQRRFKYLGEGINKALAKGMTDTALESRRAVLAAMPQHIDRPTPWIRRSLFVFPAERKDLRAAVAFKWEFGRRGRHEIGMVEAPASMRAQVYGGTRPLKGFEKTLQRAGLSPQGRPYLVPAIGAEFDRYGNVPKSFINKVFYSGAAGGSANLNPFSGGARKSRSRDARAGVRYFIHPNKKGIYRTVTSSSLGGGMVTDIRPLPVFLFTRQPKYKPHFDFDGIAARGARNLGGNIDREIVNQIRKFLK